MSLPAPSQEWVSCAAYLAAGLCMGMGATFTGMWMDPNIWVFVLQDGDEGIYRVHRSHRSEDVRGATARDRVITMKS